MNLVAQLSQFSGQLSVAKIVLATEPYEPQLQSALLGALIAAVAMLGYLRWRNRPSGWRSLSVRQKELLGQAVFAASPDAILVLDPHDKKVPMRIVDCNDQVCALHGLSRDQLIGQSIDIIEADRCWTSAGAMQVMEEIRLVRFRSGETLHKHSDGSTFPVEYSNSVIVLDGRELLLGFDRDIRVRKQAEAALRASEERFRLIFNATPVGLILMDPHDREVPMRILDCNQDAAKMNGLTLGTMIGRSIGMFDAAPLTYEQAQDKLTQLRAVGTLHGEGTHLHSDGHVFPIEYGCTLLHLNGREVLLGVDRDITERRKLDAEISEGRRLRAVGAMVGGIAHEFNNLLTPMLLYTEMLAKPSNSQEATLAYTRPLRQAIDQATNLTKRILTFGRRGTDERQRCDLAEVINDTVVLLGKTIDRRILIEVQVAAGTLVCARRTDLNQLFLNLLINARDTLIEKMESGTVNPGWQPSIRIAVSVHKTAPKPDLKAEAWWKLSFADNGMGMSAAVRERVFEPFFTTKEVGRGTGLGLATVWHVVQAEQGHIEIESTVGEGTTFQVFLPAMQDESGTARLSLGGVAPGAVSANEVVGGRRLLLVEDQPDVAESVMALLKLEDYAVHAIADGAEALNLIQTHPAQFDVIITDLNLPGLRGTELVEKLRANGFSGPLIAFSGRISAEDEARLKKVRVTAILPKPFEAKDLLALLRA